MISPSPKVVELLDECKGKVEADLAAEEKAMEEYAVFCDEELKSKGYAIETATRFSSPITEPKNRKSYLYRPLGWGEATDTSLNPPPVLRRASDQKFSDPERIPNGRRTDPEWIPNGSRTNPE